MGSHFPQLSKTSKAPETHVFWGDLDAADQLCGFPVVEGQATDGANAKHVAPMDACKISQITDVSHFIMMAGERWWWWSDA